MPEPGVGRGRDQPGSRGQRLEKVAAGSGKRGLEFERLAALRMNEPQSPRVQEHPIEAHARHQHGARERAVEGEVAVLRIADDRVARVGEMDADLVRAAGLEGDVEQAEIAEPARDAEPG